MISVEQVIQEFLRAEAEASKCARQCGPCYEDVTGAISSLRAFGGDAQGAFASLRVAAGHFSQAQRALEQLQGSISTAILQLSD